MFFLITTTAQTAPSLEHWERVGASELPKITPEGEIKDFRLALKRQIEACAEYASGKVTRCGEEEPPHEAKCDVETLRAMAEIAGRIQSWPEFILEVKTKFDWYRSKGKNDAREVMFTAYNAPSFDGALAPTEKYKHPLYAKPADLVKVPLPGGGFEFKKQTPGGFVPYDDRKAIDVDKVLAGRGLEVAYLEDPVSVLRLHIEGSGVLRVEEDGKVREVGVNYHAKNGLKYASVFQYLSKKGVDKKYLSFVGLKQYFIDNPSEMWPTLTSNPSYVFFRVSDEPPCGAAIVYLVPGHSVAIDPTVLPLSSVIFFETTRPVAPAKPGDAQTNIKFSRFALAQDTGAAIKGRAHIDTYWGTGAYAEFVSSTMKSMGTLYTPVLKGSTTAAKKPKEKRAPAKTQPRKM